MENDHQIMEEIVKISSEIETYYPELYKYIDETPMNQRNNSLDDISSTDLKNYLNTLKWQLSNHIKSSEHAKNSDNLVGEKK